MKRILAYRAVVLLFLALFANRAVETAETPATAEDVGQREAPPTELAIGGTGGVYFLASPGQFVVDVWKRDLNRTGRRTELRAILAGPDRQVLQEIALPDDGQARGSGTGPVQTARLSAGVQRKGIYALNVTVSQDRYGEDIAWGFRTNCPYYLIETARGHRDARREEPIVLLNPDQGGNVCFVPRRDSFGVEITGLPKEVESVQVFDGEDTLIDTLRADSDGRVSHTFPASLQRKAIPWRLQMPKHRAVVQIDGVTRWEKGDLYPNLPYWTPHASSYFPWQQYRWILTPYSRTVFGRPGEQGVISFQVHNNSDREKTILLEVEFPGEPWPARWSAERVVLPAKEGKEVAVRYSVPAEGQTRLCHLRATPVEDPDFSTYSTLTVKAAEAPAEQPLSMPLVLKAYRHENEQFGYVPQYPVDSQVYFDIENRPFVRTAKGVKTWRDGHWTESNLRESVRRGPESLQGRRFGMPSTKIAFDADNGLYLVATAGRQAALLHSADGGATFSANLIPGREGRGQTFDIDQFSGHNAPAGPPPLVRYTRTASDPRLIWRRLNDLELFLPQKQQDRLTLGKPLLVSRQCIGLSSHSGIPSTVVSRNGKVHVAWGEATDPEKKVPGVPTYVVTCDRETKALGKPVLVGYGPPANDVHNSPCITVDSRGYLHVLIGTHGQPFQYVRSLEPNDAQSGWTEPEPIGEGLRQTYIGMVCGKDDTLHVVYRLWRYATDPFPNSHHATLAYQRKRPGEPWEAPKVLIVSPFSEYSVFYHRLTIDRLGRLFLSYDYWSTYWFYRTDHWGNRRSLLTSADGGETWRLARGCDLR